MSYKKLKLIPLLDACHFSCEMTDELTVSEVSIHYAPGTLYIDWKDPDNFPVSKEWLIETYGKDVKKFKSFSIQPT